MDGIITNENKAQCINLSLVNQQINDPIYPASGATIKVNDGVNIFSFIESVTKPGSYYSSPFQAVIGKTYTLQIEYKSDTLSATATMVPLTASDSFTISKENGLYKYVFIKRGDPVMVEVSYDWSSVPGYCQVFGSCEAKETFYVLNNVDVNEVFGPDKQIIYFPAGTTIIRKRYSITKEHQAFLRSLLMETQWRGGVFDVQQGNVLTNISQGGLGFFSACTVATDSLVVH